jgi:hypothetical protein
MKLWLLLGLIWTMLLVGCHNPEASPAGGDRISQASDAGQSVDPTADANAADSSESEAVSTGPESSTGFTPGEATLTFTTHPTEGKYSPNHVLAVWVATPEGRFIKTLRLAADRRLRHLWTWRPATKKNRVDAVTSATLIEHGPRTVAWDGRDADGNVVPDGEYHLFIEFSERHGQGPVTPTGHIVLTKSDRPGTVSAPDLPEIKDIELVYTPVPH